jgi:hypothetical protein
MFKDETNKILNLKSNDPKKTCQTCGPGNEIEITKLKENKNKKS